MHLTPFILFILFLTPFIILLVVRHLNKTSGNHSIYRGGGSIGIIGAARSALLVAQDPDDDSCRVLAGIKSNLAPLSPSLKFHIEGTEMGLRIVWDGGSNHSADALLAASAGGPEERSALDDAKAFLMDVLSIGSAPSKQIQKQARQAGIMRKTLQRAKKALGVKSTREEYQSPWMWSLPIDGQDTSKVVIKNDDHLRDRLTTLGKKGHSDSPPQLDLEVTS